MSGRILESHLIDSIADALQYISDYHPPDFIIAMADAHARVGRGRHEGQLDPRNRPAPMGTGLILAAFSADQMVRPPSTSSTTPVMKLASSEAR